MRLFRSILLGGVALGLLVATPLARSKACSSFSPTAKAKDKLVGSWRLTVGPAWASATITIDFTRDGNTRTTAGSESREGTYEVDGDKLTLSYIGTDGRPGKETVTIVNLTDTEFQLQDSKGVLVKLTRVPIQARGTFKLKGPATPIVVKHGQTEDVKVGVVTSRDFKQDIKLTVKVDPADKGMTATVKPATLKAGGPRKVEVEVEIKADDKVAVGDYTLSVTGKPTRGTEATLVLKITVPEKR